MNRTTRKLSLTEAGEAYYREASQLLQQLDDLDASILDQTAAPRGLLRVSAARNFGEMILAPAIFAFLAEHPDVTLDLRLEDRFVDLVEEGIDVALRISAAQDSSLIARKICRHAAFGGGVAGLSRWRTARRRRRRICGTTPASSTPTCRARPTGASSRTAQTVSVHVNGPVRVNSPLSARDAALAGLGLALLPGYLADPMIASGELVRVLDGYVPTGSSAAGGLSAPPASGGQGAGADRSSGGLVRGAPDELD